MYPAQLRAGPPWQDTGQKEAGMDAACSLPQQTKSFSAAFRRSLTSPSVFNMHTVFLFHPEARLLWRPGAAQPLPNTSAFPFL